MLIMQGWSELLCKTATVSRTAELPLMMKRCCLVAVVGTVQQQVPCAEQAGAARE